MDRREPRGALAVTIDVRRRRAARPRDAPRAATWRAAPPGRAHPRARRRAEARRSSSCSATSTTGCRGARSCTCSTSGSGRRRARARSPGVPRALARSHLGASGATRCAIVEAHTSAARAARVGSPAGRGGARSTAASRRNSQYVRTHATPASERDVGPPSSTTCPRPDRRYAVRALRGDDAGRVSGGRNSAGRVSASQAECRGFDPRRPLHPSVRQAEYTSLTRRGTATSADRKGLRARRPAASYNHALAPRRTTRLPWPLTWPWGAAAHAPSRRT